MDYAFYINGIFDSCLKEIIAAQNNNQNLTCYLQPYSSRTIANLKNDQPSLESPITIYFSVSDDLSTVRYTGNIVGWDDKQKLSPARRSFLDDHMNEFQPQENGIYLERRGKLCRNLISVRNLSKLEVPIPVSNFIKIKNGTPLKPRSQSGNWSYVNELPEDFVMALSEELERRNGLWGGLLQNNSAQRITPQMLRDLSAYGGASGIWRDTELTSQYTSDDKGITVSVLHTGTSYPDDLFEDGIIYHYPHTNRPSSFDNNEIEATKNCKRLGVPLFVITHNESNQSLRDVKRGWVELWDDDMEEFLITFSDQQPESAPTFDEETPFGGFENGSPSREATVRTRPNQGRFRIGVFQRYGCKCAVCEIDNPKLLDASHLIDKSLEGTDDVRNGLVLCKNHHTALDRNLFKIEPETLELVFLETTANDIKITRTDISHLDLKPHPDALKWKWENDR